MLTGTREYRRLAADFLDAAGDIQISEDVNVISFLDHSIAHFSDAVAYLYLDYTQDADGTRVELTWGQLGVRTNAIAARLQQVTDRGERVAVMAPSGVEYVAGFFAAIKAGNVAVPLFTPDLPGHAQRLEAVVSDARPTVVLTTAAASAEVGAFIRTLPRDNRPRIIAVDDLPDSVGAGLVPVKLRANDIGYLQYTSGSTRTPTGVEISHRAAGTNLVQLAIALELVDWSMRGVSWLPLYHDMGLMMVFFPALTGTYLTFMSPMAFVRKPQRWIRALSAESRHGRVVSPAPNFAFDLAAQRGLPDDTADLDLSNVVLINGSEPVNIGSVKKFNEVFARYGLHRTAVKPSYGMAEATLFVTTTAATDEATAVYLDRAQLAAGYAVKVAPDAPTAVAHVSCGQPARSQQVVVVDPNTADELPDGEVGEIWLHGNNIGRGYWARPEETTQVFKNKLHSRLAAGSHAEGAALDATWLRTGDLGVYLDGELYIAGRIKDLIILDGRNHYPQDIEATVAAASAAVRPGHVTAFSVTPSDMGGKNDGGECLVIVAERAMGAGRVDPQSAVDTIRAAVSRCHGLPVADIVLVAAGSIPRTTSGKLARGACRVQYLGGKFAGR